MNIQATGDFPQISTGTYTSNVYDSSAMQQGYFQTGGTIDSLNQFRLNVAAPCIDHLQMPSSMSKRIVRVYLADTDDNVPLESSLLFSSEEKLTDLNDQELYFEIPIQEILKKHNLFRAQLVDKKATQRIGKEVFLEAVKIRDLKMTVVSIATF